MRKHFAASTIAVTLILVFAIQVRAQVRQPGAVYDFDRKNEKPGPAPKRDISGTWEPADSAGAGINASGAQQMPSDGKPDHELPFTPAGREDIP